jgi:hypothetical protein
VAFDQVDYRRAAARLNVPIAHIMAMASVESAGETFWLLDGKLVVPVRFDAHRFGKLTGYSFNDSHPDLSCVSWNSGLAALIWAGAWDQANHARTLDRDAADRSTSHGAFGEGDVAFAPAHPQAAALPRAVRARFQERSTSPAQGVSFDNRSPSSQQTFVAPSAL